MTLCPACQSARIGRPLRRVGEMWFAGPWRCYTCGWVDLPAERVEQPEVTP